MGLSSADLFSRLAALDDQLQCSNVGCLSFMLQMTRMATQLAFPLDPQLLKTASGGQVRGLSGPKLARILKDHGIERLLTSEGGRTSRGNMANMLAYVDFLNQLYADGLFDPDGIEAYWIAQVQAYFASQPFTLHQDPSLSLAAAIAELFSQVRDREQREHGQTYLGTVLQHLVGAKLEMALKQPLTHHRAVQADTQTGRAGDFEMGDVVIHVTAAPLQQVVEKCGANLSAGLRPVIVTLAEAVATATGIAELLGIAQRLEVWSVEQFLSANLYELSSFTPTQRTPTLEGLCAKYNEIVVQVESNPGLRIELA